MGEEDGCWNISTMALFGQTKTETGFKILCVCLGQNFLKPHLDSWNHENSPGGRFFGFKMADGDEQVTGETSDNLFLSIPNT